MMENNTLSDELNQLVFDIFINNETLTGDGISHVLEKTSTGHVKFHLRKDEELNICIPEMERNEQHKC